MSIGILTIGNELVTGFIDDTNASWLGRELTAIGRKPYWHLTLGDDIDTIQNGLTLVPDQVTDVIITGGLGPTHDDITLKAVCEFFNIEMKFDSTYWEALKKRFKAHGREIPDINRNQAIIPVGQELINNPLGSARGSIISGQGRRYFLIPGVPAEMKAMFQKSIIPLIKPENDGARIEIIRTTGIMESALAEKLGVLHEQYPAVSMAYLPRLIGLDVRLISSDRQQLKQLKQEVEQKAGKYIFGYGEMGLEEVVGNILLDKGLTIGLAESCTGGLVGHRLTQVAGSSAYFRGGIIAYSNDVKKNVLNVDDESLEKHGAVSKETAMQMAQGVRNLMGSSLGLSTTGIAGPGGGSAEKPVGLVYIGFATENKVTAKKFNFHFDRENNKLLSSQVALNMIRLELNNA